MSRMNSAWKMSRPNAKPNTYSAITSCHIGRPSAVVIAAAAMTPVASPAKQWIDEPNACFHKGRTKSSCRWLSGSWHDRT